MPLAVYLALAILLGLGLLVSASRATASVGRGTSFVRWMVVVFVAYLGLVSLPLLVGS